MAQDDLKNNTIENGSELSLEDLENVNAGSIADLFVDLKNAVVDAAGSVIPNLNPIKPIEKKK